MYGAQAIMQKRSAPAMFENDVEMYGAQARGVTNLGSIQFENDVEMYGAQADLKKAGAICCLRMM